MKAFQKLIAPDQLTGKQFDKLLADAWFPTRQSIFTLTHHLFKDVFIEDIQKIYWLRFPIAEIQTHTSHRRIMKMNGGFHFEVQDFYEIKPEHIELYSEYFIKMDFDGYVSISDCLGTDVCCNSIFNAKSLGIYDGSKIIAMGIFYLGEISCASILHFYDPRYKKYSLGKYLILLTIQYLREKGYLYYYPGYLLNGNPKMDYKLFLGSESAYWYDFDKSGWEKFHPGILNPEEYTLEEELSIVAKLIYREA